MADMVQLRLERQVIVVVAHTRWQRSRRKSQACDDMEIENAFAVYEENLESLGCVELVPEPVARGLGDFAVGHDECMIHQDALADVGSKISCPSIITAWLWISATLALET